MRVGVVANLMALGILALHNFWPLAGVHADYEKRGGHFFLFEYVENFWRPALVRTIVEGDGDFVVRRADLIDVVGEGIGFVFLAGYEIAGRVVDKAAQAALGSIGEMPDVAVAFKDQVGARRNVFYFCAHRIVGARRIPDRPDRAVRGAHAPQRRT